jgi:nicotinate phosphoribosyltransferase
VDRQALGPEGVRAARERHEAAMAELPLNGIRLSKGAPAIPTEFIGASLPE